MCLDRLDDRRGDLGRDGPLVEDGHVRRHHDPAVEGGHRPAHLQRVDQHAHASWRPPAGDREQDSALVQFLDRFERTRSQRLALGDQGPVHVGQYRGDRLGPWTGSICHVLCPPFCDWPSVLVKSVLLPGDGIPNRLTLSTRIEVVLR